MFVPVLVTPPAVPLISIDDAKEHLGVEDIDDDNVKIAALIDVVTAALDGYSGLLGRALVTQTWRQDYVDFEDRLSLPLGPVASITSVKYRDTSDVEQTWAAANYRLLTDSLGAYVARLPNISWPAVGTRDAPLSITYVAGYGAAAAVPAPIKHAALIDLERHYNVLNDVERRQLDDAYNRLIAPYRRIGF